MSPSQLCDATPETDAALLPLTGGVPVTLAVAPAVAEDDAVRAADADGGALKDAAADALRGADTVAVEDLESTPVALTQALELADGELDGLRELRWLRLLTAEAVARAEPVNVLDADATPELLGSALTRTVTVPVEHAVAVAPPDAVRCAVTEPLDEGDDDGDESLDPEPLDEAVELSLLLSVARAELEGPPEAVTFADAELSTENDGVAVTEALADEDSSAVLEGVGVRVATAVALDATEGEGEPLGVAVGRADSDAEAEWDATSDKLAVALHDALVGAVALAAPLPDAAPVLVGSADCELDAVGESVDTRDGVAELVTEGVALGLP